MNAIALWLSRGLIVAGTLTAFVGGVIGTTSRSERYLDYMQSVNRDLTPNGWSLVVAGGLILAAGVTLEIVGRRRDPPSAPPTP